MLMSIDQTPRALRKPTFESPFSAVSVAVGVGGDGGGVDVYGDCAAAFETDDSESISAHSIHSNRIESSGGAR